MAGEEEVSAKFNLDNKEALEKILDVSKGLRATGDPRNFTDLIGGLNRATIAIGALGLALLVLKGTLDLVFEGEKIRQVNVAFEELGKSVGVVTEDLRTGLLAAADGLVDDTELLKAANKAMVELGDSAQRIPETLALARKATAIFGGELVENFEKINQSIATGNVRQLKNLGLTIDVDKAVRKFADSHGLAVSALSQAARQQAIMNEVLEVGNKRFAGVDDATQKATNGWKRFKVSMAGFMDEVAVLFSKTLGPSFGALFDRLAEKIEHVTAGIKTLTATGNEASTARINWLEKELKVQQHMLEVNERVQGSGRNEIQIEASKKRIAQYSQELEKLQELDQKRQARAGGGASPESLEDTAKRLENEKKYQDELLKMKEQQYKQKLQFATTEEELQVALNERRKVIEQQHQNEILEIKNNTDLNLEQKKQLMLQSDQMYAEQTKNLDADIYQHRIRMLDNYASQAQTVQEGITRGWEAQLKKDQAEQTKFGEIGKRTYNSFKQHATDAFLEVGAGHKNMAEAARDILFKMLADEAQNRGQIMLLSGIFPPNPAAIAGGIALIALAGFLRSQAGGGSGAGAPAAAPAASTPYQAVAPLPEAEEMTEQKKTVTINFQGDYLETDATKQHLASLIRDNMDATDFTITKLGVS